MRRERIELTTTHQVVITWLPILILAVNLFFWSAGFDAFNFSKQLVLLSGVGTLLVFYVLKVKSIRLTRIEFFLVGSIVSLVVLTLIKNGLEQRYWWGIFSRANGNLTNIAFLAITLVITTYFSSKLVNRIYLCALISLLCQCLYGIIQYLKLDPIPWQNPHSPVISFFGNPNFAAASYGVLSIALVRFLNFDKKGVVNFLNQNWKILTIFCVSLFLNYETASIQGLATVGLGIYIFLGLRFLGRDSGLRYLKMLQAIYFILPLVIAIGFAGRGPMGGLLRQETFINRIEYWRIAFLIMKKFPLAGVGPDGYSQYYQEFRSLEYTVRYGTGLNSSAAHNVLLQWGASYGIIGLLIYGSLIVICLKRFLRVNRLIQSSDKSLYQTTFTIWLTYQATALVSIEQIGIAIWGWVFSGVILGWSNKILKDGDFKAAQFKSELNAKPINSGMDGLAFLLVILLAYPSSHMLRQDLALRRAVNLPGISSGVQGSDLDKRGEAIYQAVLPLGQDKDYFQFAVMSLYQEGPAPIGQKLASEVLSQDPRNSQAIEALAIASTNLKEWKDVLEYRILLTKIDPQNYVNEARIGEALYNLGRKEEALEKIKSANQKSPTDEALESFRQLQVLIESELK